MNKPIISWEIAGVLFILITGSLLHFVFDWSGYWRPLGLIAPVNESVWEHLKLVLWPTLLYSIFEYRYLKGVSQSFWAGKTLGIYTAMLLIVAIFYLYTSFTGRSILILDILIFLISVAAGQLVSYTIMTSKHLPSWIDKLTVPMLSILIFLFMLFTYYPPRLPIFQNPLDGTYGI